LKPLSVVVIASHNAGKVREIRDLLMPLGLEVKIASALGLAEPEETGASFVENAALKACATRDATGLPALADDSGLVVAALDGAPGIHSARWAGPNKDFASAMDRVERELGAKPAKDLTATFVCALALAIPAGELKTFEGDVKGELRFPPRGNKGFGYDPIFVAEGMHESFGELEPAQKHAVSHRARAFAKLKAWLESGAAA
jgi:XTP/dITP diphosphohydrolase